MACALRTEVQVMAEASTEIHAGKTGNKKSTR
jgi:hypothetical protein